MTETFEPDVVSSTLKRVELPEQLEVDPSGWEPRQGDIVAFTVTAEGGSYDQVEKIGGEHLTLEEGMGILGVICERKAVKGFVAEIPDGVEGGDTLQFIGGGGVIGRCTESLEELGDAYDVRVEGALVQNGERMNVKDFSLDWRETLPDDCPPLIMIASTRMDAGKTTLAANLIEQLSDRGHRVGAAKLTGFTRQRDRVKMQGHGAVSSYDFVDGGLITTMVDPEKVRRAGKGVLTHMSTEDLDAIVVELGGGLIDPNHVTEVLTDPAIVSKTAVCIIAAMDPVGAYGSVRLLEEHDIRPDLFSGPATDTKGGKDEIRNRLDVSALNGVKDTVEIAEFVEERL
jgi:hypothetical protein